MISTNNYLKSIISTNFENKIKDCKRLIRENQFSNLTNRISQPGILPLVALITGLVITIITKHHAGLCLGLGTGIAFAAINPFSHKIIGLKHTKAIEVETKKLQQLETQFKIYKQIKNLNEDVLALFLIRDYASVSREQKNKWEESKLDPVSFVKKEISDINLFKTLLPAIAKYIYHQQEAVACASQSFGGSKLLTGEMRPYISEEQSEKIIERCHPSSSVGGSDNTASTKDLEHAKNKRLKHDKHNNSTLQGTIYHLFQAASISYSLLNPTEKLAVNLLPEKVEENVIYLLRNKLAFPEEVIARCRTTITNQDS